MSTTRDLIDALVSGDSIAIESTFDDVMSQKVSVELDSLKAHIAQNMFTNQVEEEEVEVDDSVSTDNDTETHSV